MTTFHEISKKDWTFEKRLGWVNTNRMPISEERAIKMGRPEIAGQIFPFMTKDGVIQIFPDHWGDDKIGEFVRIPDEIEAVEYA